LTINFRFQFEHLQIMASKNQGRSSPRKRFSMVQNKSENATEMTESGISSSDMLTNAVNVTTGSSSQSESSSEDERRHFI